MKFLFNKDFSDAQIEMEKEEPERELRINPATCSAGDFKNFASSFMFSTRTHMELLSEINTKLDKVIESNKVIEGRVDTLETDVGALKEDLTAAMEFKDQEILELRQLLKTEKERIDALDIKISDLTRTQDSDNRARQVQCNKLMDDTLTLERYTRSFNFRMFNLKEAAGETTKDVIERVNQVIDQVTGGSGIQVEYGHRTGARRTDGKDRPVICRIANRLQRAVVMSRREDFFKAGFPLFDDLPAADLTEKKKHAAVMKLKWAAGQKNQLFARGKWYLNGTVYNGE